MSTKTVTALLGSYFFSLDPGKIVLGLEYGYEFIMCANLFVLLVYPQCLLSSPQIISEECIGLLPYPCDINPNVDLI